MKQPGRSCALQTVLQLGNVKIHPGWSTFLDVGSPGKFRTFTYPLSRRFMKIILLFGLRLGIRLEDSWRSNTIFDLLEGVGDHPEVGRFNDVTCTHTPQLE